MTEAPQSTRRSRFFYDEWVEEPWVRERFERELADRGRESLMPDAAYNDRGFAWEYGDDD